MGDRTGIEWTDVTWNPLRGCSRVSEGCRNCYAEKVAARFSGPGQPYEGLVELGAKGPRWNGQIKLVPEHLGDPLRWRKPRRVFVNSMSDLFHERVPFEHIAAVFGVMAASPQHTFQVLTKRPERAREFFAWVDREAPIGVPADPDSSWWRAFHCFMIAFNTAKGIDDPEALAKAQRLLSTDKISGADWPLPNVWLGVSVEDQTTADARIPILLDLPAAVRFISAEPLIGPVDVAPYLWPVCSSWPFGYSSPKEALAAGARVERRRQKLVLKGSRFLDWIIVGGESGPGARPCNVAWIRSIARQCEEAHTACFVKQLGAEPCRWPFYGSAHLVEEPIQLRDRKGGDIEEWPEDLRVREFPETAHG